MLWTFTQHARTYPLYRLSSRDSNFEPSVDWRKPYRSVLTVSPYQCVEPQVIAAKLAPLSVFGIQVTKKCRTQGCAQSKLGQTFHLDIDFYTHSLLLIIWSPFDVPLSHAQVHAYTDGKSLNSTWIFHTCDFKMHLRGITALQVERKKPSGPAYPWHVWKYEVEVEEQQQHNLSRTISQRGACRVFVRAETNWPIKKAFQHPFYSPLGIL